MRFLLSSIFQLTFILSLILKKFNSQLTENDVNFITKSIEALKDENGVYSSSCDCYNFMAIESLSILNKEIESKSFCNRIESQKSNPSLPRVLINENLKCNVKFELNEINAADFINTITDITSLYKSIVMYGKLGIKVDFSKVYEKLKLFKTKIMLYSQTQESEKSSLISSSIALRILSIVAKNNKELKEEILPEIKMVFQEMEPYLQHLGNEIAAYSENEKNSFVVNRHILEAYEDLKEFKIDNAYLEEISNKILNYFLKFKYNINSIENIHSLLKSLSLMSKSPIIKLHSNNIFIDEENSKEISFSILDAFGRKINDLQVELTYKKIVEEEEKPSVLAPSTGDSLDLEDDDTAVVKEEKKVEVSEKTLKFSNTSEGKLSFDDISDIGKFKYSLNAKFTDKTKAVKILNKELTIRAIVKLKISYLKMTVSNTSEKNDSKENKIDFPKRSFKNIKATQNSVIKLKVKVSLIYF